MSYFGGDLASAGKVGVLLASSEPAEQTNCDEAELVEACRLHPEMFGELYRRYLSRIYRYLRARTDSEEDAADLTQQVFVQALNALPAYQEKGLPFAAWLFRIARNVAINTRQRHKPTLNWDLLPDGLQASTRQMQGNLPADPEAVVLKREALEQLGRLLAQLDPTKVELLVLRFAARLTVREIAQVVGKRQGAVRKQLSRTLEALKLQFKEEYDDGR